jgi:hypothetical protein
MADNSSKSDDMAPSRRPVASASIGASLGLEGVSRVTSYETMLEISLSLMSYVRSELGAVMVDMPEVAEDLGPMLKVMHEVTLDLEMHRQIVEAQ